MQLSPTEISGLIKKKIENFEAPPEARTEGTIVGLTDGIGDVRYVAREIIGAEEVVEYQPPETLLSVVSKRFGQQAAHTLLNHLATPTLH